MLFKPEHKQMILNGKKTATRRAWKKPMVKVGGIYKCKLKMLSKEYFAKIQVTKLYKQRLHEMTLEDAKKEGYNSIGDFEEEWIKINGHIWRMQEVYVIEFMVVKEMKRKTLKGYCLDCGSKRIGMKEVKNLPLG